MVQYDSQRAPRGVTCDMTCGERMRHPMSHPHATYLTSEFPLPSRAAGLSGSSAGTCLPRHENAYPRSTGDKGSSAIASGCQDQHTEAVGQVAGCAQVRHDDILAPLW
jgi:hypothetical protein